MTPLIMGAGYIAGAYFFLRVVTATALAPRAPGLPADHGVHALHGDRDVQPPRPLRQGPRRLLDLGRALRGDAGARTAHVAAATARRNPARSRPATVPLPALRAAVGRRRGPSSRRSPPVLLLSPATMIDSWPWTLTPLTAQVLGGWFALPGVARDHDGPSTDAGARSASPCESQPRIALHPARRGPSVGRLRHLQRAHRRLRGRHIAPARRAAGAQWRSWSARACGGAARAGLTGFAARRGAARRRRSARISVRSTFTDGSGSGETA